MVKTEGSKAGHKHGVVKACYVGKQNHIPLWNENSVYIRMILDVWGVAGKLSRNKSESRDTLLTQDRAEFERVKHLNEAKSRLTNYKETAGV